jgi:putative hemolysin
MGVRSTTKVSIGVYDGHAFALFLIRRLRIGQNDHFRKGRDMRSLQALAGRGQPSHVPIQRQFEKCDRFAASGFDLKCGAYALRLAENEVDVEVVCRLRFLVFNLELGEGLESAYRDGFDTDEFDAVCDHLLVEHTPTGQVVGTYRMQTGLAASRFGYYSAREFDFAPYEHLRKSLVELGRAAIHRNHRSFQVITLLWRGITAYAKEKNARYLIGCSSLTSQCPQEGSDMFWRLRNFQVEPSLRTNPLADYEFPIRPPSARADAARPPKLLRAYLSVGARICGGPAIDREFKTIDFLTLLDLEQLGPTARLRFMG